MTHHNIDLVCGEHIQEVRTFLSKFFEEKKDETGQSNQIIFLTPDRYFQIHLAESLNQPLTHNVTLEVVYKSMKALERFAKDNQIAIKNLLITEVESPYTYHHVEIPGPKDICKIVVSYYDNHQAIK